MKKCPYCAEEIQDEAIKCKHCGEMLAKASEKSPPKTITVPKKKIRSWGWFGIIFLSLVVLGVIGNLINSDLNQRSESTTNSSTVEPKEKKTEKKGAEKKQSAPNIAELQQKAEQGDAEALFNLGLMFDNGQGVKQDYKEALKWLTKAAEQGNVLAHSTNSDKDNTDKAVLVQLNGLMEYFETPEGPFIEIQNRTGFDWTNVELHLYKTNRILGEAYILNVSRIASGKTLYATLESFTNSDGIRFDPWAYKAKTIVMYCDTYKGKSTCSWDVPNGAGASIR